MCKEEGCKTQPTHNVIGDTKPLFCFVHKKEGMVNVKSKSCEHPDCKIQPSYNFLEKRGSRFCKLHKQEGMINKRSKIK